MNSARICWSRRSSDTSSSDEPQAAGRDAPGAQDEARPIDPGHGDLLGRRADREGRPGEGLGVDGDERPDQRPADEAVRPDAEEGVGGGVGGDDPQVLVDDQDAELEGTHEIRLVVADRGGSRARP